MNGETRPNGNKGSRKRTELPEEEKEGGDRKHNISWGAK